MHEITAVFFVNFKNSHYFAVNILINFNVAHFSIFTDFAKTLIGEAEAIAVAGGIDHPVGIDGGDERGGGRGGAAVVGGHHDVGRDRGAAAG